MSYVTPRLITPSTGTPSLSLTQSSSHVLHPPTSEHKSWGDLRPPPSGALAEHRPFTVCVCVWFLSEVSVVCVKFKWFIFSFFSSSFVSPYFGCVEHTFWKSIRCRSRSVWFFDPPLFPWTLRLARLLRKGSFWRVLRVVWENASHWRADGLFHMGAGTKQ